MPLSTGSRPRLLVVDDETQLRNALCEVLTGQGYETIGIGSGEEALWTLQNQDFDILLTDLMMPGMDGIELLRAALEIDPELVAIMMTGQGTVETAVDVMKIGAYDYVMKPFRSSTLFPIVERALEVRRLRIELQRKNEELEKQHLRLQEANRLKSEFLANMSHELRTPLNGIIGFAQLMHDERVGAVSPEHKEYLGDILTSASHLLQLINDVLDLSKVESGKMAFYPEPVELGRVVAEVRDVLRTLSAEKLIQIDVEIDPEVGSVVADPARLKQILYNYLSNAIKFTPPEGHIGVQVSPEGAEAYRLAVSDTGVGIAPEEMHRLFGEFQQLDASVAKKYQGTGLGLALTKRLVEARGGSVGVESTPGVGSTFYAVLPRVVRSLDDADQARIPPPATQV